MFQALDALKVENGASHSEFMIDERDTVKIIEVGARMGGDCIGSDLVPLSTGYDFVRMVIDVACGKEPDFKRLHRGGAACIRFVFNHQDLQRLERLKREIPQHILFESEMEPVQEGQVTDSSTRFGYYILAFDRVEQAEEYGI